MELERSIRQLLQPQEISNRVDRMEMVINHQLGNILDMDLTGLRSGLDVIRNNTGRGCHFSSPGGIFRTFLAMHMYIFN